MIEPDTFDERDRARFTRLQALFREAVGLPEYERQQFAGRACGDDAAMLADLLGMIEEDARSAPAFGDGFPTLARQVLESSSIEPPQTFGAYRLIRCLGEGGMGVVYLAHREDLGNPVAIKFLRDAWLFPARRERFANEQRLLAPLNHPSIARLYDAGILENGLPWFAMEYVEGLPLTDFCREHEYSLEQRLRLFRTVCDAVQYAHEHAVIHLDLKPSNILIKADGGVRLLDFGIARQMSDAGLPVDQTRTAMRPLTPSYAAPEQIRGEPVGVFTDVYALGILLYELLTGQRPFDLPTQAGEPAKPSLLAASLVGLKAGQREWADLDILCLTAIRSEVPRRYRSVEALIRDIDRYLNQEPLEARPDSTSYKLAKFIRRNRRPVLAAAAVLLMTISLVTFFVIRLARARNEAVAQAARSERIKDFMQHLFDTDAQSGPSIELRAVDVLDKGLQEATRLDKEPKIQGELFQTLGDLYRGLEKLDRAAAALNSALALRQSTFGKESKEVAETLVSLADVLRQQGKFPEALRLAQRGLAIDSKLLAPNDFVLGRDRMVLGRVLVGAADFKAAIEALTLAVQSLSRPGAPLPDLYLALDALGGAYAGNGQFALAEPVAQKALALARRIYKPSNPLIGEELSNLGAIEFYQERFASAEKYYRAGLTATQAWYGPNNVTVATECLLLGQTLLKLKRIPEAEVFLRQALATHESLLGNNHQSVVHDLNTLAMTAQRAGNLKQAEEYYTRVLAIEDRLNGGKHFTAALAMSNLGNLKREEKQYASAEQLNRKALAMIGQVLPPDHLYAGVILLGLGKTLLKERRYGEAEQYLRNGYQVLSKQGNPRMETLQEARRALAEDYVALGRTTEALKLKAELNRPAI